MADSAGMLPEEGQPFGRYRLLERLGAGGMAIVYRAVASGPGGFSRSLVIKRVLPELSRDPSFTQMLLAEARLSARLNHPGIVQVYELGRVSDEYFLAMEHIEGVDLIRLLNRCILTKNKLPVALTCYLISEVATALAYAHELTDDRGRPLDIVHRDVSPSNVMVTYSGAVKLLDFGVAKAAEHAQNERTRTGTLKGKISYLSPEQAEGLPVDRRADLFSLGVLMHECLCMKRLFRGEGDLVTLRLVREAKVMPPSSIRFEVDPELDRIVLKMLAKDPADRYPSCRELLTELGPVVHRLGGDAASLRQFIDKLKPFGDPPSEPVSPSTRSGDVVVELGVMEASTTPVLPVDAGIRKRRLLFAAGAGLLLVGGTLLLTHSHRGADTPSTMALKAPLPKPPSTAKTAPLAATPPRQPGILVVTVEVADARVELDGKVVAESLRRAAIPVEQPGEHELVVTAPRRRPYRKQVTVPAGASLELAIKLERAATQATPSKPKSGPTSPLRGDNYLVNPFGKAK